MSLLFQAVWSRRGQAFAASLCLHAVLATWAAIVTWHVPHERNDAALNSLWTDTTSDETAFPLEIVSAVASDIPATPGGSTGLTLPTWVADPVINHPLLAEAQSGLAVSAVANSESQGAGTKSAASNGTGLGKGRGRGSGHGIGDGQQFFGLKSDALRIVYVLDCSLSMNHPHDSDAKTRFNRVKFELLNSIRQLRPDQEFFIVFFNHLAWPMPADRPVAAVPENQQRFLTWMQQSEASGDTDPTTALRIALGFRPDVIYLLTDGAFSPAANEIVRSIRQPRTTIHTFSFAPWLTDKQRDGLELMRQRKMSLAQRQLGERTYRQTREIFFAEQVLQELAAHNNGQFQLIP